MATKKVISVRIDSSIIEELDQAKNCTYGISRSLIIEGILAHAVAEKKQSDLYVHAMNGFLKYKQK